MFSQRSDLLKIELFLPTVKQNIKHNSAHKSVHESSTEHMDCNF